MPFDIGPSALSIVLVAFAILWIAYRVSAAQKKSRPTARDPRAVLEGRLARGEITRDEFDTAMRALGIGDSPG
ncbi:MAG TPA: SHOCT domain-containing protein [Candidatus Limnocylindrales bacterium]